MNALSSRIVIIAVAALFGASANGRDAQAQTHYYNGIAFAPSPGPWQISAGASGGNFTPLVAYNIPNLKGLILECGPSTSPSFRREDPIRSNNKEGVGLKPLGMVLVPLSGSYFDREDVGQFVATQAQGANKITGTAPLTGFTCTKQNPQYPECRYPVELQTSCYLLTPAGVALSVPQWTVMRPDRFTLTVTP
jgi:hypothetical protein